MAGKCSKTASRGYTLVELMIVVVIVGVMATLATYGVRKYIYASKTSEAIEMINAIKAAQEAYKDETFTYLDVSGTLSAYYPMPLGTNPGQKKYAWDAGTTHAHRAKWMELGVSAGSAVQFGYATVAGGAADPVAEVGNLEANRTFTEPNKPWYIVKAVSDLNGDGVLGVYVSSNFMNDIYVEREGE